MPFVSKCKEKLGIGSEQLWYHCWNVLASVSQLYLRHFPEEPASREQVPGFILQMAHSSVPGLSHRISVTVTTCSPHGHCPSFSFRDPRLGHLTLGVVCIQKNLYIQTFFSLKCKCVLQIPVDPVPPAVQHQCCVSQSHFLPR